MSTEESTVEQPTAAAGEAKGQVVIKTDLVEFSELAEGLNEMYRVAHGVVFDLTKSKDNDSARKLRKQLVSTRTAIERRRVELNQHDRASIQARIASRDTEAQRLIQYVRDVEQPIDEQITADELRRETERREREEADRLRVEALRQRIADIAGVAVRAVGLSCAEIETKLSLVSRIEIDATFEEMQPSALNVKNETVQKLQDLLASTKRQEAERAQAEANRIELERLQQAERDREVAEAKRRQAEQAERDAAAARERERLRLELQQREAAEAALRQRRAAMDAVIHRIRAATLGVLTASAAQVEKIIEAVKSHATPPDLGDLAGLVDKARDDALAELEEVRAAKVLAEEAQRVAREQQERTAALMGEIDAIGQLLVSAQVAGAGVVELEAWLAKAREITIDRGRFGMLYHGAQGTKAATILGLEQLLEQAKNTPAALPVDDDLRAVEPAAAIQLPGSVVDAEFREVETPAAAQQVDPIALLSPSFPGDFIELAMALVSEVASVARAASRPKAVTSKDGPYTVPAAAFRAMCEALTRVPLPKGQRYDGDGTLLDADGSLIETRRQA